MMELVVEGVVDPKAPPPPPPLSAPPGPGTIGIGRLTAAATAAAMAAAAAAAVIWRLAVETRAAAPPRGAKACMTKAAEISAASLKAGANDALTRHRLRNVKIRSYAGCIRSIPDPIAASPETLENKGKASCAGVRLPYFRFGPITAGMYEMISGSDDDDDDAIEEGSSASAFLYAFPTSSSPSASSPSLISNLLLLVFTPLLLLVFLLWVAQRLCR
mmetsp:Transcript_21215/g.37925  ORF Transcript_21215/g.37925 Transcript_21215/m.37925 type:complete len:217 (-) Transcript_21215:526-1176(-)